MLTLICAIEINQMNHKIMIKTNVNHVNAHLCYRNKSNEPQNNDQD